MLVYMHLLTIAKHMGQVPCQDTSDPHCRRLRRKVSPANMSIRNVILDMTKLIVDMYMRFESDAGESYAEIILEQQRSRGPSIPWIFRPNRLIAKWLGIQNGTRSLTFEGLWSLCKNGATTVSFRGVANVVWGSRCRDIDPSIDNSDCRMGFRCHFRHSLVFPPFLAHILIIKDLLLSPQSNQ